MVLGSPEMGKEKEGAFKMKNLPQKRSATTSVPFSPRKKSEEKHTYLRVGDKVFHEKYRSWGGGIVVETWTSDLPGGLCFARVLFQDGKQRVFDNSFDSVLCCYHTGITLLNRIEL